MARAFFWTNIRDGHQDSIEGYRQLIAHAEQQIQALQAVKATADEQLSQAKETAERLRKGDNVPVAKPLTREEMLRVSSLTEKQAQHCEVVAAIHELGGSEELVNARVDEPMGKRERRIARAVLRNALKRKELNG
jgi:hypothetical protein